MKDEQMFETTSADTLIKALEKKRMRINNDSFSKSNETDQAADCAQFFTDLAINAAISGASEINIENTTGLCFNCCEKINGLSRFCDVICRDEFQENQIKASKIAAILGK